MPFSVFRYHSTAREYLVITRDSPTARLEGPIGQREVISQSKTDMATVPQYDFLELAVNFGPGGGGTNTTAGHIEDGSSGTTGKVAISARRWRVSFYGTARNTVLHVHLDGVSWQCMV